MAGRKFARNLMRYVGRTSPSLAFVATLLVAFATLPSCLMTRARGGGGGGSGSGYGYGYGYSSNGTYVANAATSDGGTCVTVAKGQGSISDAQLLCIGRTGTSQLGTSYNGGYQNWMAWAQTASGGSSPLKGVSKVSMSHWHTCIVSLDGSVHCAGRNQDGEAGGTPGATPTFDNEFFTPVSHSFSSGGSSADGLLGNVTDISLGTDPANSEAFSCSLSGGKIYCWGRNRYMQLGINSGTASTQYPYLAVQYSPDQGITTFDMDSVQSLSAGGTFACAVRNSDLRAYCWGNGISYNLGNGHPGGPPPNIVYGTPVATALDSDGWATGTTPTYLEGVQKVSAGLQHACALKGDTTVWCWGYNDAGQTGQSPGTINNYATQVTTDGSTPLTGVTDIVSSSKSTCAIAGSDSRVYCWGSNKEYALARTTNVTWCSSPGVNCSPYAKSASPTIKYVMKIYSGNSADHFLVIKTDGTVYSWGRNTSTDAYNTFQLGYDTGMIGMSSAGLFEWISW